MKTRIICNDPEHPIDKIVDVSESEFCQLCTKGISVYEPNTDIDEIIAEEYSKTFLDLCRAIVMEPAGSYNISRASKSFEKAGQEIINQYYMDNYSISLIPEHSQDSAESTQTVTLLQLCRQYFSDYLCDYIVNADITRAIVNGMNCFAFSSKWQCAYVDARGRRIEPSNQIAPLMWFGPEGVAPNKCWILNPHYYRSSTKWKSFWFPESLDDDVANRIKESDSVFVTWLCEIGENLPDLSEILDACPVKVTETSKPAEVTQLIKAYYSVIMR